MPSSVAPPGLRLPPGRRKETGLPFCADCINDGSLRRTFVHHCRAISVGKQGNTNRCCFLSYWAFEVPSWLANSACEVVAGEDDGRQERLVPSQVLGRLVMEA